MPMPTALLRRSLELGTGPMPDLPGGTFSPLKQRVPIAKQPKVSQQIIQDILPENTKMFPVEQPQIIENPIDAAKKRLEEITGQRQVVSSGLASYRAQLGVEGPPVIGVDIGNAIYSIDGQRERTGLAAWGDISRQLDTEGRLLAVEQAQLSDVEAYLGMEGPQDWPQVLAKARLEEQDEQAFTQKALELWERRHVTPADQRREKFNLPGTDEDVTPGQAAGDARRRALIASMSKSGFESTKKLGTKTILGV